MIEVDKDAETERLREENKHLMRVIAAMLEERHRMRLDSGPYFAVKYADLDRLEGRAALARTHSENNEVVEYKLLDGMQILPL